MLSLQPVEPLHQLLLRHQVLLLQLLVGLLLLEGKVDLQGFSPATNWHPTWAVPRLLAIMQVPAVLPAAAHVALVVPTLLGLQGLLPQLAQAPLPRLCLGCFCCCLGCLCGCLLCSFLFLGALLLAPPAVVLQHLRLEGLEELLEGLVLCSLVKGFLGIMQHGLELLKHSPCRLPQSVVCVEGRVPHLPHQGRPGLPPLLQLRRPWHDIKLLHRSALFRLHLDLLANGLLHGVEQEGADPTTLPSSHVLPNRVHRCLHQPADMLSRVCDDQVCSHCSQRVQQHLLNRLLQALHICEELLHLPEPLHSDSDRWQHVVILRPA